MPGRCGDNERYDRAYQHHPLDAKIEHAGTLGNQFTQRGEDQRRACGKRERG